MSISTHTPPNLYLAGLKHCGKTTLGKMLAARTARPFYDLDDLLLHEAQDKEYSSVRELYRSAGREKFQDYEAAAAKKARGAGIILSLGGGTIENYAALQELKPKGSFIYFTVDEEVLFNRIQRGGLPPFLIGDLPPQELFHALYRRRHELYVLHSDLVIELPDQAVEKNFELLYSQLKDKNYVW